MTKKIFYIVILLLPFVSNASAQVIPQDVAVRVIVSEAADQGLRGMICVAEVLRRRASIKGFYGYRWNHVNQPKFIMEMAGRAWKLSGDTNYTKGADHFENVHRFGPPWWARYCIKTYEYRDHVFYKEISHK